METLKILHTGDIQVKCREEALYRSYNRNLKDIESILINNLIDIYVIDGDLFEYATPNDAERKLIYNHLARVLAMKNIKEVVLMAGNHDLVKDNKSLTGQESENAINTFVEFILSLNTKESSKLIYLKDTDKYISKADVRLGYLAYSLEDDWNARNLITSEQISAKPSTQFDICLYHDILKEYIDETKLPIKKEKYNSILSINDFASRLIIGADIHKNWKHESLDGKFFQYCGSSIQRNFGEGSEINLKGKSYKADGKVVKMYEITWPSDAVGGADAGGAVGDADANEPLLKLSDMNLHDFICYNNIVFDDVATENCLELLKSKLDDIQFGQEQTFIKIKLSNLYISLEAQIQKIVSEYCSDQKRVSIEVVYDKFVSIGGIGDSKTRAEVKAIFDEVDTTSTINDQASTTEIQATSLKTLDDDKLRKLFSVALNIHLETVKKEFGDIVSFEILKDEILGIFADELTDSMGKISKYSHDFEFIECNAFMALGPNKIRLDIPGITKITGTNGIGKTTLHSMLRWVIKDEVFEGMSKANKVKNTLFAFNDKQPTVDIVNVLFQERVNGTLITINRTAKRTWNKDVTLEQKSSIYWKNFIAGVERNLTITVFKKNEDGTLSENKYTGDQAEGLLATWYGSTVENIMFLNAAKINYLLKMPSIAMTELILDYVGIDYLRKLEENLPAVQLRLNKYAKPTKTREALIDALTSLAADQNKATAELEELNNSVNNFIEKIADKSKSIDLENAEQLKSGDIEALIVTNKSNQITVNNSIATFTPKELKTKISFDVELPVEQDCFSAQQTIDSANTEIANIKELIAVNITDKTEAYQTLANTYNKVIAAYQAKVDEQNNQLSAINQKIKDNIALIDKNNSAIVSGKCDKCQRAFDNNYDAHKEALLSENKNLLQDNVELELLKAPINENIKKFKATIDEYTKYFNISLNHTTKDLPKTIPLFIPLIEKCENLTNYGVSIQTEQSKLLEVIKQQELVISTAKQSYINSLTEYNRLRDLNVTANNKVDEDNVLIVEHNKKIDGYTAEVARLEQELLLLEIKLPAFKTRNESLITLKAEKTELEAQQKAVQTSITGKSVQINNIKNQLKTEELAYENFINYSKNKLIGDIYSKLVKRDFKDLVFQFYRNFLNDTLNLLLEDINFKLFWNVDNELYMIDMKNGNIAYRPVQSASGMEMAFLGLSLIYAIHTLNVRNSLSNLFIDEISGVLNKGEELSYVATNYQEQMVMLLSKFSQIRVYIVDHVIENLFETSTYEVGFSEQGSKFKLK